MMLLLPEDATRVRAFKLLERENVHTAGRVLYQFLSRRQACCLIEGRAGPH